MLVRSIRKSLEVSSDEIFNSDMKDWLDLDLLFNVYGIRITKGTVYFMVFMDDRHLVETPSGLFNVEDDQVSSLWKVRILEDGDTVFWPELFFEEDFLENFSEREDKERAEFEELKSKMYPDTVHLP